MRAGPRGTRRSAEDKNHLRVGAFALLNRDETCRESERMFLSWRADGVFVDLYDLGIVLMRPSHVVKAITKRRG